MFPTVRDVAHDLRGEVSRLQEELDDWQRQEVAVNIFLLSSAVADAVDDFMAGESYDFSTTAVLPGMRALTGALERLLDVRHRARALGQGGLRRWRAAWGAAQDEFLQAWLGDGPSGRAEMASKGALALAGLLNYRLPRALSCRRINVPAAFRTQDLTHHDVLELAARFAALFPDRERPLLVVGLRTAGSYFAPLVRASLALARLPRRGRR